MIKNSHYCEPRDNIGNDGEVIDESNDDVIYLEDIEIPDGIISDDGELIMSDEPHGDITIGSILVVPKYGAVMVRGVYENHIYGVTQRDFKFRRSINNPYRFVTNKLAYRYKLGDLYKGAYIVELDLWREDEVRIITDLQYYHTEKYDGYVKWSAMKPSKSPFKEYFHMYE